MKVHHLNCISSCPLGGHLMDAQGEGVFERGHLTNHCLLIETPTELILVDTGFGLRDVANPHSRLSSFFLTLNSPAFKEELTAYRQIENLGYDPNDVRHIVLTHLDFDHAGGLDDFPEAQVHMMQAERDAAVAQATWLDRQRFRPQQWSTRNNWQVYNPGGGDKWFGFDRVQSLRGISDDVALIPLVRHTHGHAGVAVRTADKWMLNTGDAYFFHGEMDFENPHCTPGLNFYQLMMDKDHKSRLFNQSRLRELRQSHRNEVEVFCAHDVVEFERLSGRSARIPEERLLQKRRTHAHAADADRHPS